MLVNKNFRKKVIENIGDPVVKSFWAEEFANYTDRYTQEATPAIQNKIGQFTSNPLIRNIVGQSKSSFDLRQMMDEKKIIIMNLSKGRVGEVNANLLGSDACDQNLSGSDVARRCASQNTYRTPIVLLLRRRIPELCKPELCRHFSEARKYKLNLIIAHQYIEQMEEEVRDAVFGNVGTTVAFRVGPFDAEVLETIFQPQFTQADLVNLGFAQIYLTLMIDGVGSPPFSATTMSPFDPPPERFVDQVIKSSREQFGRPRVQVEQALAEWSEVDSMAPKKVAPKPAQQASTASPEPIKPPQQPSDGAGAPQPGSAPASRQPVSPPRPAAPKPREYAAVTKPVPVVHAPRPRAPEQRAERAPEKPPIEGATSLREALAMATGGKKEKSEAKPDMEPKAHTSTQPHHQQTLKEALGTIVGEQKRSPAQLPEETLRDMLRVDEPGNANKHS
jgi:hypothetical protein